MEESGGGSVCTATRTSYLEVLHSALVVVMASVVKSLRKAPEPRAQSLRSVVSEDKLYDNVAVDKLYHAVLKLVVLEYISEARFYQPVVAAAETSTLRPHSTAERRLRLSRIEADVQLPPNFLLNLKAKLNQVAMNSTTYDASTRRLLLRFYGDILDPLFASEFKHLRSIDVLVMKFVASANKEMVKLGLVPAEGISAAVFTQAQLLIRIMIGLVLREKNRELLESKLNEHMTSLKPKPSLSAKRPQSSSDPANCIYPEPSFALADMDQAYIKLLMELFLVDRTRLEADVARLKSQVSQKALHKDVEQVLFYVNKDLGWLSPDKFSSANAYNAWKDRELHACALLTEKYAIPTPKKLLPLPLPEPGEEFLILPSLLQVRPFTVHLIKLCLLQHRKELDFGFETPPDVLLFSNKSGDLLALCARVWRVDYPTRATALFVAAHLSGLLVDPLFATGNGELGPIDLNTTTKVLTTCRRWVEESKMNWDDKQSWCLKDKAEWTKNLGYTYSSTFHGIKDCLGMVLSKSAKPKFSPYLNFLGEYVESDSLFPKLEETGLVSKWQKKLTKSFLRTSECLYAEILSKIPRDSTLSIVNVLDAADDLVEQIKLLQKRYKNPLLGFLNVSHTYAALVAGMFASDAKNMLHHIVAHVRARNEFLNYGDALEAYKSLQEIRSIYLQVAKPEGRNFSFNIEDFFYPYLEAWVAESGERIQSFVANAIENDEFKPIDIENDEKKYSTSVHDIFSLIKRYLDILKGLNWQNPLHLAKIYTTLTKSICDSCLLYSSEMSDMVMKDLANTDQASSPPSAPAGWMAEMKNIVSNLQNPVDKAEVENPINFSPTTCIGLNNISEVIKQFTKLENLLRPEDISEIVTKNDPKARHFYTSHIFSIRVVKAENLRSSSDSSNIRPYMTLIDTQARRTIAKTRTMDSDNPEWDEEFEITLAPNENMTMTATVWEEKFGAHSVCGRALLQLEPRKFKHDGIAQEVYLDLDSQGRILIEIAVESEREDAVFAMGRAHRALRRSEQRITKMIVTKFSKFIKRCFSRSTLKFVCGGSGNIKPTQEQMDEAMKPLYNYLNMNLLVLAQYLSKEILLRVMLEAWNVVVASADELLLPKLTSARVLKNSIIGYGRGNLSATNLKMGWQSAVSSAVANVTNSIGNLGFGKTLTANEIETVIAWLDFLCIDFFHNGGNGPPVSELKTEQYQSILLIPVYYDYENTYLIQEVERLSPAFLQMLRDKNSVFLSSHPGSDTAALRSRAGSIARSLTIRANATAQARAKAAKEANELRSDPLAAQTSAENIILRLLLVKDGKQFVVKRMEERERLAHTIATERLARAVAEGTLFR